MMLRRSKMPERKAWTYVVDVPALKGKDLRAPSPQIWKATASSSPAVQETFPQSNCVCRREDRAALQSVQTA